MLLRELAIKNYKSLEEVSISGIGNLAAFVGPNNAGKTCILEVLTQIPRLHFSQFAGPNQGATGHKGDKTIEVTLCFDIEETQRKQALLEMQPLGLRAGIENTEFFKRLRMIFMNRPDGLIFGNTFCPVSIAISDEHGIVPMFAKAQYPKTLTHCRRAAPALVPGPRRLLAQRLDAIATFHPC